jgi:hypothetical protein
MSSNPRPWRDIMVQTVASVMIPITVAAMGWYYTRWQQNLADLKTMIDLVSDESPERQKYGIAMFEYLLKNDKVPVEFVAAQLDYANSSSDPELLTLMESALLKAAQVNPSVGLVFTEAVERLPARIFIHVTNDEQRACVRTLITSLKDTDKVTIAIPAITKAKWDGKQNELRVLKDADVPRAEILNGLLQSFGFEVNIVNLAGRWSGAKKVRPNTFELWLADVDLPPACGGPEKPAAEPAVEPAATPAAETSN